MFHLSNCWYKYFSPFVSYSKCPHLFVPPWTCLHVLAHAVSLPRSSIPPCLYICIKSLHEHHFLHEAFLKCSFLKSPINTQDTSMKATVVYCTSLHLYPPLPPAGPWAPWHAHILTQNPAFSKYFTNECLWVNEWRGLWHRTVPSPSSNRFSDTERNHRYK